MQRWSQLWGGASFVSTMTERGQKNAPLRQLEPVSDNARRLELRRSRRLGPQGKSHWRDDDPGLLSPLCMLVVVNLGLVFWPMSPKDGRGKIAASYRLFDPRA